MSGSYILSLIKSRDSNQSSKSRTSTSNTFRERPKVEDRLNEYYKRIKTNHSKKNFEQKRTQLRVSRSPELCSGSQKLIQKSPRVGRIEDRLNNYSKKKQHNIELKTNEEINAAISMSSPNISPLASKLVRQGDVFSRLLLYQQKYKNNYSNYESNTQSSEPVKPNKTPSRYLMPQEPKQKPQEFSFKPELNKNSVKIAERLESPSERLLKKPQIKESQSQYLFRPSVNKSSESRKDVWNQIYQDSMNRLKERSEKLLELKEKQQQDPECTFVPKRVTKDPLERSRSPQVQVRSFEEWNLKKLSKIQEKRNLKSEDGIEECTFSPRVSFT